MKAYTKFSQIIVCVLIGLWMIMEGLLMNTSQIAATRWEILIISLIQLIIALSLFVLPTVKVK
jgi:heme/copper-type cytochrome/quinol oxidase subunit 4